MDKLTKEAIEEYREEVNKVRRDIPEGKESPLHKFGYKARRGDELFRVTDFGNIEKFWLKWLSKVFKAGVEEGKAYQGKNKRVWYQKGFKEGKKEV